jgi:excisionase family DNA binding protein
MGKPETYPVASARKKPETLSVPEAGRRVGLGKNASYEAARRGELPVLRFGRKLRVPSAALDRMLAEARPRSSVNPEVA